MLKTRSEISAFSTDRHGKEYPTVVAVDEQYEGKYVSVRITYRKIGQKQLIAQ